MIVIWRPCSNGKTRCADTPDSQDFVLTSLPRLAGQFIAIEFTLNIFGVVVSHNPTGSTSSDTAMLTVTTRWRTGE
jgi:hypothetical protein